MQSDALMPQELKVGDPLPPGVVVGQPIPPDSAVGETPATLRRRTDTGGLMGRLDPLLERFSEFMEQTAFQRETLASKGAHPKMEAFLTTLAPHTLASMARLFRQYTTPTGVGLGIASVVTPKVMAPIFFALSSAQMKQAGIGTKEWEDLLTKFQGDPDKFEQFLLGAAGVAASGVLAKAPLSPVERGAVTGTRTGLREVLGAGERAVREAEQARAEKVSERTKKVELADRRSTVEQQNEQLAKDVRDNVKNTHAAVRKELDTRWESLREKVGDAEIPLQPINDAIIEANDSILRGSPESIRIFNNILHETPSLEEASIFRGAGQIQRSGTPGRVSLGDFRLSAKPAISGVGPESMERLRAAVGAGGPSSFKPVAEGNISFNDARGYFTELGEKMFSSENIPGDVYRALRHVRNALDTEISKAAKQRGVLEDYTKLKADWRDYMSDFHDMSAVSRGGSPLARTLRAPDPGYAADPFLGKAGERAVGILGKYTRYGADPSLGTRMRANKAELSRLPRRTEIPEMPKPTDPADVRMKQLQSAAERFRRPSHWDILALMYAVREMAQGELPYALAYPLVRRLAAGMLEGRFGRWVAGQPRAIARGESLGQPSGPAPGRVEKVTGARPLESRTALDREISRLKAVLRNPNATAEEKDIAAQQILDYTQMFLESLPGR